MATMLDRVVRRSGRSWRRGAQLATRSEDTAGRLRVTAPVTLAETLLGEVVAECLARHPQMRLELVPHRSAYGSRGREVRPRSNGDAEDTSVVAHELERRQLRCFASREYLRDRGTPLTLRDLRRHECILFAPLAPRGRWTFRSRARAMEVPARGRLVVNSIPLAIEAAARGLGIATFQERWSSKGLRPINSSRCSMRTRHQRPGRRFPATIRPRESAAHGQVVDRPARGRRAAAQMVGL
jgi:DNA-binding transcriptional LysR family regulator